MGILRRVFVPLIYLVILATSVTACDENKKVRVNGAGNGSNKGQNEYQLADDLKGFQLTRKSEDDPNPSVQAMGGVANSDLPFAQEHQDFLTTDKISVKENPKGTAITFKSLVQCYENRGDGRRSEPVTENQVSLNINDGIEMIQLLPREHLYRPANPSGDAGLCEFSAVYVEDPDGNKMAPIAEERQSQDHTLHKVVKKVLAPQSGRHRLEMSLTSNVAELNTLASPRLTFEQLQNELIVRTNDHSKFDRLEIECSNFVIEKDLASPDKASFMNFMDLRLSDSKSDKPWDYFSEQDCRIFSYMNSKITGYTNYFRVVHSNILPQVQFNYSGPGYYGTGYGGDAHFHRTEFATMTIHNSHPYPVGLKVDVGGFNGQGQFVSITDAAMMDPIHRRYMRSEIKTIDPEVRIMHPNGVEETLNPQPGTSREIIVYPNQTTSFHLSFNSEGCEFWKKMRQQGRDKNGMQGLLGVLVTASSPAVTYHFIKPDSSGQAVISNRENGVISPTNANAKPHFVFATNNNTGDWQNRLKWPTDQYFLGNPTTHNSGPFQVCHGAHEYFK